MRAKRVHMICQRIYYLMEIYFDVYGGRRGHRTPDPEGSRQRSKLLREPTHALSIFFGGGWRHRTPDPAGSPRLSKPIEEPTSAPSSNWSRLSESNRLFSPLPRECSPSLLKRRLLVTTTSHELTIDLFCYVEQGAIRLDQNERELSNLSHFTAMDRS